MSAPVTTPPPSTGRPLPPFWIWPALSLGSALLLAGGLWLFLKLHTPAAGAAGPEAAAGQVTFQIIDGDGQPGTPLPDMRVPDFAFTERSGRMVRRQDLQGQVWVADFIFTHCTGTCPIMTSSLKTVQESCKNLNGLRLVSFTVDPERDTPARLSAYADSQGADPERWLFLTGDQQALYSFAREAFKLAVGEGKSDPETAIGEAFIHSTRLVLIDASGRVVGMYSGTDKASVEALVAELRRRLPATPDGSPGKTPTLAWPSPATPATPAASPAPIDPAYSSPTPRPSTHPAAAPAP